MRIRRATSALAWCVAAIAGCGPGSPGGAGEPVGTAASPIQGGASDTTHTFAVGICGGAPGGPSGGDACALLCSGVLVAPNLVLTARHCFDDVSNQTVDCSTDTFGARMYPVNEYFVTTAPDIYDADAKWYSVSQVITPTESAFCGNDIAVVVLAKNVSSSEAPVLATPEIWFPVDATQYAARETAIGYGADAPDDSSSAGTRRILEKIPIECVPGDTDEAMACAPVATSGVAANEFQAGDGPCDGDSGSSAYEQNSFDSGSFLSLGVLSRGGTSGNTCSGSIYTQLYPWQSLILDAAMQAAAAGSYALPSWTVKPVLPGDAGAARDGAADASSRDAGGTAPESGASSTPSGGSGGSGGGCTVGADVAGGTSDLGLSSLVGVGALAAAFARRRPKGRA